MPMKAKVAVIAIISKSLVLKPDSIASKSTPMTGLVFEVELVEKFEYSQITGLTTDDRLLWPTAGSQIAVTIIDVSGMLRATSPEHKEDGSLKYSIPM